MFIHYRVCIKMQGCFIHFINQWTIDINLLVSSCNIGMRPKWEKSNGLLQYGNYAGVLLEGDIYYLILLDFFAQGKQELGSLSDYHLIPIESHLLNETNRTLQKWKSSFHYILFYIVRSQNLTVIYKF